MVWIGYIQWLRDNGFGYPADPILKALNTIKHMDAVLAQDENGVPYENEWPEADVIIGNPPFLGDKRMRAELGHKYVNNLRSLYKERIPGGADFVTYWFDRAWNMIANGFTNRAGFIATHSIRGGANRKVLEQIKTSGDIFMAWSDRPWIINGASVRVSMIGFGKGDNSIKMLNGMPVAFINSDLTALVDVTKALPLKENKSICFLGMMKGGPFDIDDEIAQNLLSQKGNPNNRPNADVIKRRLGAQDIVQRSMPGWIIDFVELSQEEASLYEGPFEYGVKRKTTQIRITALGNASIGRVVAVRGHESDHPSA